MNEKYYLIQKLKDPRNETALDAIEKLRQRGWLTDGSLANANLRYVHIQGANLHGADLRKSNLNMADMRWADLSQANLAGARLTKVNLYQANLEGANLDGVCLMECNLQGARNLETKQLAQAYSLLGATMPDGSRYNGRYDLAGDLQCALVRRVDLNDSTAKASFYGIPNPVANHNDCPNTGLCGNSIEQLIRKLRSSDCELVTRAIEELRKRGRLSDGTLAWSNLRYVHLANADLSTIHLRKADLSMADLQATNLTYAHLEGTRLHQANLRLANFHKSELNGAILSHAILQGAQNLTIEQLAKTSRLRGAMMPDGSRYDGRYNLPGDLADAHFLGLNLDEPAEMANFYGVSIKDFNKGQKWTQTHLPDAIKISVDLFQADTDSFLTRLIEHGYQSNSESKNKQGSRLGR